MDHPVQIQRSRFPHPCSWCNRSEAMRELPDDSPVLWRPLSFAATLRAAPNSAAARGLLLAWVAITLLCVALGIYQVKMAWNGLPVHFGGLHFSLTIYP